MLREIAPAGGARAAAWSRDIVIDSCGAPCTSLPPPPELARFGTASGREPEKREISAAGTSFRESRTGYRRGERGSSGDYWEETMKRLCIIAAGTLLIAAPAFAAADTITIGMTVSQTGSLNVDSVAQLKGSELWRDEVNAAGGIKAGDKHYKVRFVELRRPVARRARPAALYAAHRAGHAEYPLQSLLLGAHRDGGGDQRAIRQGHGDRRRRGGQDLPARQQVSVPSHHLGRPISLGRDPGAQGEDPARQDRASSIRTTPSPRRSSRRRANKPPRPGSRKCWSRCYPPRPRISARSSTRSSRPRPTRSWAAATIPTAPRLRASSMTRRRASSG